MIGIKFFFGMIDGGHVKPDEWGWAAARYRSECVAIFLFQDDIGRTSLSLILSPIILQCNKNPSAGRIGGFVGLS